MSTVGFVGAGRMGAPMVRRLVEAGHSVRVLGRTAEKRTAIGELGAQAVGETAGVADGADVVVVCVFTDDQVRAVCLTDRLLDAMSPGGVLVVHTTGSPETVRALAAHRSEVAVIDAPVSGGPHDIASGRITLFVGGDDGALERVRPVLAAYGDPILHVGRLGAGQWVKLINNTLFASQLGMLREAVALGARAGVKESGLLAAIGHGSGASRVSGLVAARGSVQGFVDAVGEFIGKDIEVVRAVAAETGSGLGLLDALVDNVVTPQKRSRSPTRDFGEVPIRIHQCWITVTVSVTVDSPLVKLPAPARREGGNIWPPPNSGSIPCRRNISTIRTTSTNGCATKRRSTTTPKVTSTR